MTSETLNMQRDLARDYQKYGMNQTQANAYAKAERIKAQFRDDHGEASLMALDKLQARADFAKASAEFLLNPSASNWLELNRAMGAWQAWSR